MLLINDTNHCVLLLDVPKKQFWNQAELACWNRYGYNWEMLSNVTIFDVAGTDGSVEVTGLRSMCELPYVVQFLNLNKEKFDLPCIDIEVSGTGGG